VIRHSLLLTAYSWKHDFFCPGVSLRRRAEQSPTLDPSPQTHRRRSHSNITPLPRSNVFVVFNSVDNTPVAPFAGTQPRPPFIAERKDFTPVG